MLGVCNTTLVTEAFDMDIQYAMNKRNGALPLHDAITMSLDIASGLQALHEAAAAPIVHFDVKPAQMLLTSDGRVKLNDFNTAWFMSTGPDGTSCPFVVEGKPHPGPWRSPEYLSEKVRDEGLFLYVSLHTIGFVYHRPESTNSYTRKCTQFWGHQPEKGYYSTLLDGAVRVVVFCPIIPKTAFALRYFSHESGRTAAVH